LKICLWLCCLLCASAFAVVPYSETSDLVRTGRVVFNSQPGAAEYRLVLSSIKKVNNQWRAKEKVIPGALLSRMTVELDERASYGDTKRQLQKDMATAPGFTPLFQCSGLDCGSSSGWANEILRVKQLYGMDSSQFYAVLVDQRSSQGETYVVWYLIQRGNGRIYLQQDVVRAGIAKEAASNVTLALQPWSERLDQQSFFIVPGVVLSGSEPAVAESSLELLAELVRQNPERVLRLVGHDYAGASFAERERRSLFYAQWLRDRLIDRDVAPARLTAHGLASLAPAGRVGESRIEVVQD
jgi:hypothetical protein